MTPGEWTPARLDLLRDEYASAEDNRALLDRINALDGAPILSVKSMSLKAKRIGLRKTAEAMAGINERRTEAVRRSNAGRPVGVKDSRPRKPREVNSLGRHGSLNFRAAGPSRSYIDVPVSDDPGIRRYQRARALIAQGKDPYAVAASVGIPAWRALGIVGEIRQERAAG